jgi:hypothetical protein
MKAFYLMYSILQVVKNLGTSFKSLYLGAHIYFRALRRQHMRSGEGFILVYSITSRSSFTFVKELYQEILRTKGLDDFPVVLVATKSDLEYDRKVSIDGTTFFPCYILHLMT